MSRHLIALAAAFAATTAGARATHAQPATPAPGGDPLPAEVAPQPPAPLPAIEPPSSVAPTPPATPERAEPAPSEGELGDQVVSAEAGIASGGRVTPGGLRINGHYLYQLSERDWFDGVVSFTFGSGRGGCFRDRSDAVICRHGLTDGAGVELSARIRRMLTPRGVFHPFAQIGIGLGLARFSDDDVSGVTFPLHVGGGVRVAVAPTIAIVIEDEIALGIGSFSRGLGIEPQFSFAFTAGVEFQLR
jgi:opacity protein-like surface antigen